MVKPAKPSGASEKPRVTRSRTKAAESTIQSVATRTAPASGSRSSSATSSLTSDTESDEALTDVPSSEDDNEDGEYEESDSTTGTATPSEPMHKAQGKLRKAIAACKRILQGLTSDGSFGSKGVDDLDVVMDYAQVHPVSLPFSRVRTKHLKSLGVTRGDINLNMKGLEKLAATRTVEERFECNQRYLDQAGLSHKERLAEFYGVDFIFESMFNPGTRHKEAHREMDPKLAPELHIKDVKRDPTAKLQLNGYVDLVTFMVKTGSRIQEHDVRNLQQIMEHSNVVQGTLVTIEVKRRDRAFDEEHIAEAVAQAMSTSEVLDRRRQRFILTDGKRWKFCIYDREQKKYFLSQTLDLAQDRKEVILTALDEWTWNSEESNLWAFA